MGQPILKALIAEKIVPLSSLTVVSRSSVNSQKIKPGYPAIKFYSNVEQLDSPDYIIIAVKPQDFPSLAISLRDKLVKNTVVVSVMAGISIAKIQKALGVKKVVRVMPNLAIELQQAVIACVYDTAVITTEQKFIKRIFAPQGLFLEVADEKKINQITALAGSGPAYVAFFMSSLEESARRFGFPKELAEKIVWQTFFGTIDYLNYSKLTPSELIVKVKSKGGTTEAALDIFKSKKINQSLQQAFLAAFNRSVKLSK